jgi:hypothetical protein
MAEKERVVQAIHRLATDEEFRLRFMVTPREILMAELGISGETYRALVSLVPVVLAGGLFVLGGGVSPEPVDIAQAQWGSWGRA